MKKYINNYQQSLNFDSKKNQLYQNALDIPNAPKLGKSPDKWTHYRKGPSGPNFPKKNSKLNKKFIQEKKTDNDDSKSKSFDSQIYLEKVLNSPEDVYVVKFNNYSEKYGIGYSLSNGSKGMLFNDKSGLLQTFGSQ